MLIWRFWRGNGSILVDPGTMGTCRCGGSTSCSSRGVGLLCATSSASSWVSFSCATRKHPPLLPHEANHAEPLRQTQPMSPSTTLQLASPPCLHLCLSQRVCVSVSVSLALARLSAGHGGVRQRSRPAFAYYKHTKVDGKAQH